MGLRKSAVWCAAALAVTAGSVLAVGGPAQQAVAFFSPPLFLDVQVDSPATLVANGAAVDVPVEVTCTSGTAQLLVSVSERVGSKVASGGTSTTVPCSRGRDRFLVNVSSSNGLSFRQGQAFVSATVFGCTESFCGDENDAKTVPITR